MKKKKTRERVLMEEESVIGNLKNQFTRSTLHGQRRIGISPAIANGNIALGYYRGLAVGAEEERKSIIRDLKKKFPKAAAYLNNKNRNKLRGNDT